MSFDPSLALSRSSRRPLLPILLGALLSLATATQAHATVPSATGDVVVTWSSQLQSISGFGASVVFFAKDMTPEDADFLFSPERGLGLSLLRVSVGQDGTCPEILSAKKAAYYGVKIWASSWTPPAAWKTNNDTTAMPMAHLIASHFGDQATYLADYIDWMKMQGIDLLAISPQNEPDYESSWDGCLWTDTELMTFVRDNLGPTLAARNQKTKIMIPETASWNNMDKYVTTMFNNATAKGYTSIVATHPYSVGSLTYTKPKDNGKEFWETEVSQEKSPQDTPDPTITSALTMVSMIHDHIITSQMNAWNWWATIGPETLDDPVRQNPALIQNGVKYKRAYALGNFAKFIRPGWVRLATTEKPATNIRVSGYRDPNNATRVTIVAVNSGTSTRSQKFWLDNQNFGTVTPWVTSPTADLEKQTAVSASSNNFTYTLPAQSIVTFVNWNAEDQGGPAVPPPPTPMPDAGADGDTTGAGGDTGAGGGSGSGAGGAIVTGAGGGGGKGTGGTGVDRGTGGSVAGSGTGGNIYGTGGETPLNPMTEAGCKCAVGDGGAPAGTLPAGLALVGLLMGRRRRR